ncbi:hypothetical protein T12_3327 [Trichinella patagoniensis]|uniref:Uncharacterized protein n=1 Tax=Trichinella patagoniensis TaxID=990121 RepID=A0A0V0ZNE3_9BILA|nr:hypothetical protein T12_3327 [Trichinella patagoniensis]
MENDSLEYSNQYQGKIVCRFQIGMKVCRDGLKKKALRMLVESRRTLSAHYANYFCLEIVSPIAMRLLPVFSTDVSSSSVVHEMKIRCYELLLCTALCMITAAWNETEAEEDFFIEKSLMSLKNQSINLIIVYWNSIQMGLKL